MIYQWLVKAVCNGDWPCETEVLASTEDGAKREFEEQAADWLYGKPRYKSVTKTGMVLVHESQVKRGR